MKKVSRIQYFLRRYISSGFGWQVEISNDIITEQQNGTQFAKDVIWNIPKLFKRHKTYVKRKHYFLIIHPLKGVLSPLVFFFFFVPALLHELTYALALRYTSSYSTIQLLPMMTEIPFIFVWFLHVHPLIKSCSLLIGVTGLVAMPDLLNFLALRKRKVPHLANLFQTQVDDET